MSTNIPLARIVLFISILGAVVGPANAGNPFVGRWTLTLPDGRAGWLGVTQEGGYLDGSILWGGGSVLPVASAYLDGEKLILTRLRKVDRKNARGEVVRTQTFTETIITDVKGDELHLTRSVPNPNDGGITRTEFTGKRIAPLPPKPGLSQVKYDKPVQLLKRSSLAGWTLTDPDRVNGWSVKKGVLSNNSEQHEGEEHIRYGNLRTVQEFEDFNLKLEVNVGQNQNSGVYLRGVYEIQVFDSYGKELDPHNMGAVYSRITPSQAAEKAPGKWQTMDITLLDRHVTVILNGKNIIDNAPLLGCTGGALWADEFRPGPIFLQGDHTGVKYRNVVLRPIVK